MSRGLDIREQRLAGLSVYFVALDAALAEVNCPFLPCRFELMSDNARMCHMDAVIDRVGERGMHLGLDA